MKASMQTTSRLHYRKAYIMADAITHHLRNLITAYNELAPSSIQELDCEPSPLEFMRFVARNTPFVARGVARHWKAVQNWTPSKLVKELGDQRVNVAVTPNGYVHFR